MEVMLKNVRLAGHSMFTASAFQPTQKPRFSATVIFDKSDAAAVGAIQEVIQAVAREKWGDEAQAMVSQLFAANNMCLHDGAIKANKPGYGADKFYVTTSSYTRPTVVGRNRQPVVEADNVIYSGCYVNLLIDVWAQDHPQYGKRINASFKGCQFFADGDSLGGAAPADASQFEDYGDESAPGSDWQAGAASPAPVAAAPAAGLEPAPQDPFGGAGASNPFSG